MTSPRAILKRDAVFMDFLDCNVVVGIVCALGPYLGSL
jgi:hypothetical protein